MNREWKPEKLFKFYKYCWFLKTNSKKTKKYKKYKKNKTYENAKKPSLNFSPLIVVKNQYSPLISHIVGYIFPICTVFTHKGYHQYPQFVFFVHFPQVEQISVNYFASFLASRPRLISIFNQQPRPLSTQIVKIYRLGPYNASN